MKEANLGIGSFTSQHFKLLPLLAEATPAVLDRKPKSGKWSVRETVAHLARYQVVFLERMRRAVAEDEPNLGRYSAEQDAEWPEWRKKPVPELTESLKATRAELTEFIDSLTDEQRARRGEHPAMGALMIDEWTEFFLLHEAHHLFAIFTRVKALRNRE